MKKTPVAVLTAAIAITLLMYPPVHARALPAEAPEGIQIELIVDGLKRLDEGGLYRVTDSKANKIIYILNTNQMGSQPQIFVIDR